MSGIADIAFYVVVGVILFFLGTFVWELIQKVRKNTGGWRFDKKQEPPKNDKGEYL